MSLSQDPAFTWLKQYFVCGYRDITTQPYCGMSGRHEIGGRAIRTSNGAGPHNIQIFMLSPDGTVLNCLPGFWSAQDLIVEMRFAYDLNKVWQNKSLSSYQKTAMFKQMHIDHIAQHPPGMVRRSKMQGFDAKYEAKNRLNTTDTILDKNLVLASLNSGGMMPMGAFKTTDEIMHERMVKQPFVKYENFDVASFCDYGLQKYDKHEDSRDSSGQIIKDVERGEAELGRKGSW